MTTNDQDCHFDDSDECAMDRERAVAGISDTMAECPVHPVPVISTGHLGYSWTIEGGIVEVFTDGQSIRRAPLSNPIMSDGSRSGREWWPDREPFRSQWYPLTFATIAEAEADRKEAGR